MKKRDRGFAQAPAFRRGVNPWYSGFCRDENQVSVANRNNGRTGLVRTASLLGWKACGDGVRLRPPRWGRSNLDEAGNSFGRPRGIPRLQAWGGCQLIKAVAAIAAAHGVEWYKVREGADHTVYRIRDRNIAIPRHNEISEGTARGILDDARKEVHR